MKFGIILGSTREGRVSPQVGAYIQEIANQRSEHQFEIVERHLIYRLWERLSQT